MVEITELVDRPDGTKGLGGSYEVSVEEAIKRIEKGEAVAHGHSAGVVPEEFLEQL